MEASLRRWSMGNTGSMFILVLSVILVIPYAAIGQDKGLGGGNEKLLFQENLDQVPERLKKEQSSPTPDPVMSGVDLNSLGGDYTIYEHDQMWDFDSQTVETQEVGDVNGDGIDDFAIAFTNLKIVEIYWGGDISNQANQVLELDYTPVGLAGGDFNGDGAADLAISDNNGRYLSIFFGGSSLSNNADQVISVSDVIPNVTTPYFYNVSNIGDVNKDGKDDLLLGSVFANDDEEYLNEAYLFYGGDTFSDSPLKINLSSASSMIEAGITSSGLGDINGDGIDDFAIAITDTSNTRDYSTGVVLVYHGGEQNLYEEPVDTLKPERYVGGFGYDIAAGDFTGNGVNDIAVTARNLITELQPYPPAVHIFYGKEDLSSYADTLLKRPIFGDGELANENSGHFEVVNDFNNDGKDELLLTSFFGNQYNNYSNAALYTFTNSTASPSAFLKAPDLEKGLGGLFNSAIGDFTGNGNNDIVLIQAEPSTESETDPPSSVYRYELPTPIKILSIEDFPEDHGGKVRLNLDGYLLDAADSGISDFDSLIVKRRTVDGEWYEVETIQENTREIDIAVPETQPSNDDSIDNSFVFEVDVFSGEDELIARSNTATGRAFDNIPPPQVQTVSLEEQEESESKTLSWQEVDAPDEVTYLIFTTDRDDQLSEEPIDTVGENSYTLPDHFEGVQTFVVAALDEHNNEGEVSPPVNAIFPQTAEYTSEEEWNLIGMPVNADEDSRQSLLQDLTIYEYDGGYKQVSQLEQGKGYWAKFTDADARTLEGLPFTEFSIDLKKGWNLVSGVGGELPVESIEDPDEIVLTETVYAFDQGYTASDALRPGYGYWVRASNAGTVTLKDPRLNQSETNEKTKKTLAKTSEEIIKEFTKVVISDGSNSTELFFGEKLPEGVNKLQYSLPPLPPGDVFDARFEGDTRLMEEKEVYIQLHKIENKSLTLEIGAPKMTGQDKFVIKEFIGGKLHEEYKVSASQEFSLKNKDTDSIYLSPDNIGQISQEIPDKFDLEQNYPNPFNPTTQIQYSVAEATEVKLEIFNILGRRVRTLINERKMPGNYEVTFNGANLASGIYLYRLQAGDFVSTKKFILAK